MTDLFRIYNGRESEQDAPVIPQVPLSFYGLQRSWEPINESEEAVITATSLEQVTEINPTSDALGSTMDFAPRSDDGSQRQDKDEHALEQVAMPKPGPRRTRVRTVIKEKSTQTFGLIYTAEIGVQTDAGINEYDGLELEPLGAPMAACDRVQKFLWLIVFQLQSPRLHL